MTTTLPAGTILPRVLIATQNADGTITVGAPVGGGSTTVDFTATNTKLDTINTTSTGLSAKLPATLGQTTKANSLSVVNASDAPGVSAATPSYHRITDGTSNAAVKAASTAPVAADPALVVSLHPNSVQPKFRAAGTTTPSTITTGGSAQTAIAANAARNYLLVQNNSTADLWLNFSGTATLGGGLRIVAGDYYESPAHFIPTGAISIFGATTGQAFTAVEA